jgi:hypothetical protein
MIVRITKKAERNLLACIRSDKSYTITNAGPGLPHHDIAHYVVESQLELKNGFFGLIAKGYTIDQLSDPEIIRKLGPESWLAEILTRALQSLHSRACTVDQFLPLVQAEVETRRDLEMPVLNEEIILIMLRRYQELLLEWSEIKDGNALEMEFV